MAEPPSGTECFLGGFESLMCGMTREATYAGVAVDNERGLEDAVASSANPKHANPTTPTHKESLVTVFTSFSSTTKRGRRFY